MRPRLLRPPFSRLPWVSALTGRPFHSSLRSTMTSWRCPGVVGLKLLSAIASDSRGHVDLRALGEGDDRFLVVRAAAGRAAEALHLALDADGVDRGDLDLEQPLDRGLDLALVRGQRHAEGHLVVLRAHGRLLGGRPRAKFSSTVGPSMISTEPQPSLSRRLTSAAVFASASFAVSSTISLPSACLAESAVLSARRRTFFCSENSWLRTTGPKITAPPRNCGERRLPWRARPVPFWRHGFLVVPWTSLMPLVLCVPARRLASCQLTMRARMSRRTGRPNTASARSMLPTSLLSRLVMASFMSGSPSAATTRRFCVDTRSSP